MYKPKISIILGVYNVEDYIVESLQSIIHQTIGLDNLEIIMVNDGSTDRSKQIVDEYGSKYENFRAIHFDKASGAVGKPRNVGIKEANGEYIMFLDPDDLYIIDACEVLYKKAKEHESDFVIGTYEQFNSKKTWQQWIFKNRLKKELINVSVADCPDLIVAPPAVVTKIFKTKFIKNNNILFLEGVLNEDAVFAAESLFLAKKVSFVPKVVYKYRVREDNENPSTTQNINYKFFNDFNKTRQQIIELYKKYNVLDYYELRYIHDLNYLTKKMFDINLLVNEEKIKVFYCIQWFMNKSQRLNLDGVSQYCRILITLIVNKEYEQAIEYINLNQKNNKYKTDNDKLKKEIDRVNQSKENEKKENLQRVVSLNSEINDLKKDKHILKSEVKSIQNQLEETKKNNEEIIAKQQKEIKQLNITIQDLKQDIKNLGIEVNIKKQRIKTLLNEKEILVTKNIESSNEIDQLRITIKGVKKQINSIQNILEEEKVKKIKEVNELIKKLKYIEDQNEKLKLELNNVMESSSWKFTKPLRTLEYKVKQLSDTLK